MPVFATAALLGGLGAAGKYITGAAQKRKGEKLEDSLTRPTYKIPGLIYDNQKMAADAEKEGLPSAQRNAYLDQIGRQETSTLRNFRGRKAGLMGAEVAGQQALDAQRQLMIDDVKQRIENRRQLYQANQVLSNYQDQAFQINEMNPYETNLNHARALQGAGMQNKASAFADLTKSASSFANAYAQGGGFMGDEPSDNGFKSWWNSK